MMRRLLLFLAGMAFAQVACAQVIEDIEVKREGPSTALITIRFAVRIQYLRSATNARKDVVQVFFRVIGGDEDVGRTLQEYRNSPPNDLVPKFTVTYPFVPGNGPRRLDIQFERPVEGARMRLGRDSSTIRIEVPVLKPAAPATSPRADAATPRAEVATPRAEVATPRAEALLPPPAPLPPETGTKAAELLAQARAQLEAGRGDAAIESLNELLNLPPSPVSREAQELIGVARERRGDLAKARVEYELFLKLYPQGADADRVRSRLAVLGGTPAQPSPPLAEIAPEPARLPPKASVWGSVSQYYYGGQSQSQTEITTVTPATNATTIDTFSLSSRDQSAIGTSVDLNARYITGEWDDRMVFRETYDLSFLKDQPNRSRLSALYAEANYRPGRGMLRLGRQAATSGGVLGRFDGVVASYGITPRLRVSAVGGRAVDQSFENLPTFYGVAVDVEPAASWSGAVYGLRQRLQGYTDRTAVGGELRYFNSTYSVFGNLDYDATFRAVNIGMLQATWQSPWGSSVNFLGDYRRSPSLALTNALLTGRNLTLQQFVETFGESSTREQARAITPVSKVFFVGLTHPFSPRWQAGFDLRVSSLGGLPEIGLIPALPSTGNVYTTSAQLIGTAVFGASDVFVANASHLRGSLLSGTSLGVTERLQFDRWVFEPSLRYYRQRDSNDVRITRWAPSMKLGYRAAERLTLEAEATLERTRTVGPAVDDDTTRRFYFVGYRWDF
jgi:tetratricopeptide (TPR) repeat protein